MTTGILKLSQKISDRLGPSFLVWEQKVGFQADKDLSKATTSWFSELEQILYSFHANLTRLSVKHRIAYKLITFTWFTFCWFPHWFLCQSHLNKKYVSFTNTSTFWSWSLGISWYTILAQASSRTLPLCCWQPQLSSQFRLGTVPLSPKWVILV